MLTTSHGFLLQLLLQNTPHTYSHLSKQHNHCTKNVAILFCTNVFFLLKKAPYLLCWWVVHSRCETEAQCVRYPMHYCKYSVPVLEERNYPPSSQALLSNITNPTQPNTKETRQQPWQRKYRFFSYWDQFGKSFSDKIIIKHNNGQV